MKKKKKDLLEAPGGKRDGSKRNVIVHGYKKRSAVGTAKGADQRQKGTVTRLNSEKDSLKKKRAASCEGLAGNQ